MEMFGKKKTFFHILILLFLLLPSFKSYPFSGNLDTKIINYSKRDEIELRGRFSLNREIKLKDYLKLKLDLRLYTLNSNKKNRKSRFLAEIEEGYLNFYSPKFDILLGFGKIYWGVLDEVSLVDVVNPLDISKFFLDMERKSAKRAVFLFNLSYYFKEDIYLDFLLLPFFKRFSYDFLDEEKSPFKIISFLGDDFLPKKSIRNIEYGTRFKSIFKDIDYSFYYFRGFGDYPLYRLNDKNLEEKYLREVILGYDFESVIRRWGIRGEGIYKEGFFQKKDSFDYLKGGSLSLGFGVDRSFNRNYFNFSLIYKRIFLEELLEEKREELSFIFDYRIKSFYERKILRLFSNYNQKSKSSFLGILFKYNIFENSWLELILGFFEGEERDLLSRLKEVDFLSIVYKYCF